MALSTKDMHIRAQHEAMNKGPRVMNIHGELRTVYGLTKAELRKLFVDEGFNVTTRSRWRSIISDWTDPDLFGDLVTADKKTLMDKNEIGSWCVVFQTLTKEELLNLAFTAEENNCAALPNVEDVRGASTCRA